MKKASTLLSIASLGSLLVANSMAFAAEPQVERSRADVVSETLAARASGTLVPAGESLTPILAAPANSLLTRSDVRAQVLTARVAGSLIPAGEGESIAYAGPVRSSVTRAEVKASVIAARKQGELVPAGEAGPEAESYAHARVASSTRTAQVDAPFANVAKR